MNRIRIDCEQEQILLTKINSLGMRDLIFGEVMTNT